MPARGIWHFARFHMLGTMRKSVESTAKRSPDGHDEKITQGKPEEHSSDPPSGSHKHVSREEPHGQRQPLYASPSASTRNYTSSTSPVPADNSQALPDAHEILPKTKNTSKQAGNQYHNVKNETAGADDFCSTSPMEVEIEEVRSNE